MGRTLNTADRPGLRPKHYKVLKFKPYISGSVSRPSTVIRVKRRKGETVSSSGGGQGNSIIKIIIKKNILFPFHPKKKTRKNAAFMLEHLNRLKPFLLSVFYETHS